MICCEITMVKRFFDLILNMLFFVLRFFRSTRRTEYVSRIDHFFSDHEPFAYLRIQQMREALRRQSQNKKVHLLKSILHHGFCAIDLPRKSPRHRSLSERSEEHTSELQSRPHLVCR